MALFRKVHVQLSLDRAIKYTGRGGRRAGRPRGRKKVSHDKRPTFASRYPQHVTLRAIEGAPNLARGYLMGPIRKAIRRGDKVVEKIVEEAAEYTGIAIGNLVNLLNPEVVVLGGGVIEALSDEMMPTIVKSA